MLFLIVPIFAVVMWTIVFTLARWHSLRTLFDTYRPELHYMRGPGPKWREKHGPFSLLSAHRAAPSRSRQHVVIAVRQAYRDRDSVWRHLEANGLQQRR
jgi:hypothetical protein